MAKRKRSKESNAKGISIELTGLILILVGVIGFGFGYIGSIIKSFSMFFNQHHFMLINKKRAHNIQKIIFMIKREYRDLKWQK